MNNPYLTRTTVDPAELAAYTSAVLLSNAAYTTATTARCHMCAQTAEPNRSRCVICADRDQADRARKKAA